MASHCNEIVANEDDDMDVDALLHAAVWDKDAGAVRNCLQKGANVNALHRWYGMTPLFEASVWGAPDEIVQILLNAGANTRWRNKLFGLTAAGEACHNQHLTMVEILIDHDNGLLEITDFRGDTPLFNAIHGRNVDIVRFLINRSANLTATNFDGLTPLLCACETGVVAIVRLLLDAGADMEARAPGSEGNVLHHAASHGKIEIVRELILHRNANMFAVNAKGETPFDVACNDRFQPWAAATIGPLLRIYGDKKMQDHGRLVLHDVLAAAKYSFLEAEGFHPPLNPLQIILPVGKLTLFHFYALMYYLNAYLMIQDRDDSGRLPIHIACQTNAPVEVLALLVQLDPATLHTADHDSGALPLHECCCRDTVDYSSVRYLVEQGGVRAVNARDRQGALPLHVLCGSTNPSVRTVQYLVQSFPATVSTRTHAGEYPFLIEACETASALLSVVYELVRAYPALLDSME